MPKIEQKGLQGDRCVKCQVVLTVEVRVGFPVDLTVDAEYVQNRVWGHAPFENACRLAFRHGERSARDHQKHGVDGVAQFRWKVQKLELTFMLFVRSVECY